MRIYIGSDHAGYEYRKSIIEYLIENGYEVIECMHHEYDENDDYCDAAFELASKVEKDEDARGILICGTGIGMSIAANRNKNIRAAVCHNEYEARLTRFHNDANVLCVGARTQGIEVVKEIVKVFLNTQFSNLERYIRRNERLK